MIAPKRKQELPMGASHPTFSNVYGVPAARLTLRMIRVRAAAGNPSRGWLTAGPRTIAVALGRGGIRANKWEGDGGTPRGRFHPLQVWWRQDRHPRPRTQLPARPIRPDDAWCEDPASRHYNRAMRLAADALGDRLARNDHLYDYIVTLDHNTQPLVKHRGSAVFLHLAREGYGPTAGCVAMRAADMRWLLARLSRRTRIVIG